MTEPADNLLLKVSGLQGWYGESHVLHGIDFEVRQGEVDVAWPKRGRKNLHAIGYHGDPGETDRVHHVSGDRTDRDATASYRTLGYCALP